MVGGSRKSILASDNGEMGSFDASRFSLTGNDYLKNDFIGNGEDSSLLTFHNEPFSGLSDIPLSILPFIFE